MTYIRQTASERKASKPAPRYLFVSHRVVEVPNAQAKEVPLDGALAPEYRLVGVTARGNRNAAKRQKRVAELITKAQQQGRVTKEK